MPEEKTMADTLRVVHYLNAFFGGLGGEEEAHTPLSVQPGPVGPGRLLEQALAGHGQVSATLICGDGYFAEHEEAVVEHVRPHWHTLRPDVFIAAPAFRAGRTAPRTSPWRRLRASAPPLLSPIYLARSWRW